MQEIIISKVDNGYICKWKEESENEEDYIIDKQIVFEIKTELEERLAELECLEKLFNFLQEQFGCYYDKYLSNINISIEKKE